MNPFPVVDPIPLPAPVWLFKGLHVLTLGLHFVAVEMLLGGLLLATCLSFLAARRRDENVGRVRFSATNALARRLPIVMTYVINLGVPPLLFAQVLYGRAIYTSSVLIGVYWISVIFLLMACYWLLYRFSAGVEARRPVWWLGAGAWLLAGLIAGIYSTNMTLMLRPEVWGQMYSASALGALLPPHDPTLAPRWLFMLAGGIVVGGLWMIWLSGRSYLEVPVRSYLAHIGGRIAAVAVIAQLAAAHFAFHNQPEIVRNGLAANPLYLVSGCAWFGTVGLIVLAAAWVGLKGITKPAVGWTCALLGVVSVVAMTIVRDGIRDLTLLSKGFDVWQRTVVTNWSVVVLFLLLFVAGLGALAWLISVMVRAKPVSEKLA